MKYSPRNGITFLKCERCREWEVWDAERVENFIKRFGTPKNPTARHKARMKLAASLVEGKSLLDVGCGLGHLYPLVKNKVENYLGVDNSIAMVDMARKLQPNAKFQLGDIYDLSRFGQYDSVCCLSLLLHLPNSDKPIEGMWKHAVKCLILSVSLSTAIKQEKRKYKDGYVIYRWETWKHISNILNKLKGVQEIKKYPQDTRVSVGLKGRNYTVKVVRKTN